MSISIKMIISGIIGLISIGVLLINSEKNNAGPDWIWMGGKNDPSRNLLCKPDGKLRKSTKPVLLTFMAIFIILIWVI